MAKIKITLTEEHIKLIKNFKIINIDDTYSGFDKINPYGGCYPMEDIAMILGYWGNATKGSENHFDGRKFGLELEQKLWETHCYVQENFDYILSIITQYVTEGVKPGIYTALNHQLIWEYHEN